MLWTGTGVRRSNVQVEMTVMHDQTGQVIPAMPDQPFDYLDRVKRSLERCKAVHRHDMHRYDKCMVTKWQVNTVPLTPSLDRLTLPRHRLAIENHAGGLANLYPDQIKAVNITENKVFLRLMRAHYREYGQHRNGRDMVYSTFSTDIDICNKQLRVRIL